MCLLQFQGGQVLADLFPPVITVAAPRCPYFIELSWWERPVFSRVKLENVWISLLERCHAGPGQAPRASTRTVLGVL